MTTCSRSYLLLPHLSSLHSAGFVFFPNIFGGLEAKIVVKQWISAFSVEFLFSELVDTVLNYFAIAQRLLAETRQNQ